MRSYVTKHVENDCTCSMMGLPRKRLTEIIAAGGVPLVSIETDKSDGGVRLHIKRRTLSSQYVAISHVWSDGMGNPNDNALPVCQIRRLHQYLEALPHSGNRAIDKRAPNLIPSNPLSSKSVLFWMDTLCIPVGSAYVDLRMQSINRMASIYATAMQVLILDAELQKCRTKGTLANELLVRILGSNWMARSWTFQEGALGIDCIFQFADTALDPIYAWCESGPACGYKGEVNFPSEGSPDHNTYSVLYTLLWDRLRQGWKSPLSPRERPVAKPSERLFLEKNIPKIPGLRSIGLVQSALQAAPTASRYDGVAASEHFRRTTSDEGRALQLVEIWNELGCRTTSMTEDIHVIIANLLDFHAGDVMDPSGKIERMHAILLSFDYLPFSLFYDTGSKCKDLPNTWLPVEPSGSSMAQYPLMKRNLDGFLLMKSNSRTHEPTVLLIESNVLDHKSFHVRKTGQNESLAIQLFRGETSSTLPETKSCCLVIETDLFDSSLTKTRGALFRVTETKARFDVVEELRAVYCCPVEELRAVYCCPVEAEKLSSAHVGGMCIDPDDSVSQVHNAQKVHPSTKLVVEYGDLSS
ncbi:hypothetical protein EV356DRAFT_536765 [Viridothelium virens]|uniref:Heterokaryon incompatibility domain-containing protein n=1 Tax=Viridothelium virens TaxID=1048519 RepID=A0A6A6GW68_VIRVR|nr:hypothetical protein EV356DRAFT_536765 [Viridothelium virens]